MCARRAEPESRVIEKMRAAGLPQRLIDEFIAQYRRYRAGEQGKLSWGEIEPPEKGDIVDLGRDVDAQQLQRGRQLLDQLVCIKLNGGLGTTMKLSRAKSLIEVREGNSFLRLVALQMRRLRERHHCRTPLLLMNSFRTRADSLAALADLEQPAALPLDFLQHKVPRVIRGSGEPLALAEEELNWAPPGHGDIYLALLLGGLLQQLVDRGYRWAFVSNVDNLAATVDPQLLGYLDQSGIEFAMEVTAKSAADVKGGTLARHRGRLTLLERAQVEEDHLADFEDIDRLRVFNTNSLWWRLDAMLERLRRHQLALPLIVNPKTVGGVEVVQLETAMGAAIGCFERARGIQVPRLRFAPVKGTVDLLAVRSDAFVVDAAGGIRPHPQRPTGWGPPVVRLDPIHYQGIGDFDRRIPHPLGLRRCRSLTVEGDVRFGREVEIIGDVVVRNTSGAPRTIADGRRLADGTFEL